MKNLTFVYDILSASYLPWPTFLSLIRFLVKHEAEKRAAPFFLFDKQQQQQRAIIFKSLELCHFFKNNPFFLQLLS